MGMIGSFYSVTDGDLAALVERPSRVRKLMGLGEGAGAVGAKSFLGRLFGKQGAVKAGAGDSWTPEAPTQEMDVDKAWQGIHFLLTGDIGEKLYERADREELKKNDVYPDIWEEDKEDCIGYLTEGLKELRAFVEKLAAEGKGIVVMLT